MIMVNTSYQSFENVNSCGELIVSAVTYSKNNFTHIFVQKRHENPEEISQKFKTTVTHYFINERSYLNISAINRQKHLLVAIS